MCPMAPAQHRHGLRRLEARRPCRYRMRGTRIMVADMTMENVDLRPERVCGDAPPNLIAPEVLMCTLPRSDDSLSVGREEGRGDETIASACDGWIAYGVGRLLRCMRRRRCRNAGHWRLRRNRRQRWSSGQRWREWVGRKGRLRRFGAGRLGRNGWTR